MKRSISMALVMAALFAAAAVAMMAATAGAALAGPVCNCRDIYEPVICSNGVVYGNICYARCAGAHHCTSYGG